MPYPQILAYVQNQLRVDVAAYLTAKSANFPNAQHYYGANNQYFNEHTVQAAMLICLDRYVIGHENPNHVLLLSEYTYPGFYNRADILVVYNNGGGPSNLFIELKADFTPQSVDYDIDMLDAIAGAPGSPVTDGFAFYVYRLANPGWTNHIDDPLEPNVYKRGIGI